MMEQRLFSRWSHAAEYAVFSLGTIFFLKRHRPLGQDIVDRQAGSSIGTALGICRGGDVHTCAVLLAFAVSRLPLTKTKTWL